MSLSETMEQIEDLLAEMARDLGKVLRGNLSAAQRVRVGTLRMEKVGKRFRKESLHAEKSGKFKKLKKKAKKRKRLSRI